MSKTDVDDGAKSCPSCSHANRPGANFCENCGEQLADHRICAACGEVCGIGQRFCHACGAALAGKEPASPAPPSGESGNGEAGESPGKASATTEGLGALRGRVGETLRASSFGKIVGGLFTPFGQEPDGAVKPGADREGHDPADAITSGEAALYGPAETVRANVVWGVLAIASAVAGQWLLGRGQTLASVGFYAAGILLALWAFRKRTSFPVPATLGLGQLQRLRPLWLLPILLLPGAAMAWSLERLLTNPDRPPDLFWILHASSVVLFVGCVWLARQFERIRDSGGTPGDETDARHSQSPAPEAATAAPWTTGHRLVVILIICIGLFMRVHQLSEFPAGTWYDEATAGLEAQRILSDPDYRPLYVSGLMGPEHYVYLISFLFLLLPKITFVVRLATVITGVLSVPAAYLAGSQLFGRGPALVLAFLIATSRWSVNFSRIGMFNILMVLFVLLGVGLLLKALRRGRLTDYMWAGLFLGFGLNTYYAFQLFLAVVGIFLLYFFVTNWNHLLARWKGLVLLAMGVTLFLAPLATFAFARLDRYLERTRTVSIFEEYPEEQVWGKVRESAVTHLLMYNVRGDPNGRHNLPGEPMLAPITGALLALGLALSFSRIWRPRFLLLILWFFGLMAGGIFALSFEAPQSLRAIGTMPAAYLLALLPLALLWQNWRVASYYWLHREGGNEAAGSSTGRHIFPNGARISERFWQAFHWQGTPVVVMAVLAAAAGTYSYRTYFVRQMNDFAVWNAYSTGETIAATVVAEHVGRDDTDVYLTSHYAGHPSVRFIGSSVPFYQAVDYTATLPMPLSPERDALFLMDPERRNFFEQARSFYPGGEFVEHKAPFGGPTVLYEIRLRPSDIASIQGMHVAYYEGEDWTGEPVKVERQATVAADWSREAPVAGPFSAEWRGILNVEKYGPHKLVLRAPGPAELYVNEELAARIGGEAGVGETGGGQEATAALNLALGLHRLRVRAVGGEGPISLSWQRPGEEAQIVPSSTLHVPPVASTGLLGKYYANGNWEGTPAFTRIDPQINLYFHDIPLPRPYTVEWEGKLAVPHDGVYRLGIESIDESELWIDGEPVAASPEPNQYDEESVRLTAGLHDIRIRYVARTSHYHVNLHWAPPGQDRTIVQSAALVPPQGSYDHLSVEDLAIFERGTGEMLVGLPLDFTPLPREGTETPAFETVSDALQRPRGVAAANERLYVVDPAQKSLFVLDSGGRELVQVRRSNRRFGEPVDVAADALGNVYVLDAGDGGQVSVHDADGDFIRVIPLPEDSMDRSRGIDVDQLGRIWVAMTPALAVAAFDEEGRELARISTALQGGDFQPVDVAYMNDEAVYVTTVGTTALIRFSLGGEPSGIWPLAPANSVDGPHLALGGDGTLYITQPELGQYLSLAGDEGKEIQIWILPASSPIRKLVGVDAGSGGEVVLTDSENGRVYLVPAPP